MTRAAKPINDKCQDTRERIQIVCNFTSLFAIFAIIFVPICPFYPIATFHLSALIGGAAHDCYMQITDYPLQERLGDQWLRPVKLLSTFSQPQHDASSRQQLSVLLCLCN